MKKVVMMAAGVGLAGLLAVAGGVGRKPLAVEVGVTSRLIVAAANQTPTNAWAASKVVAADEILHVDSNEFWWVVGAGTCWTGAPTHYDGDATNGTATLRYIHKDRSKIVLRTMDAANVWLAFDNAAAVDKGILLRASGADTFETDYQGAIYGISSAATNTVLVHDE